MGFSGWQHRVKITIAASYIDSNLTDWTLVFDQSFDSVLTQVNGPLDADGTRASLNGGGDVRFSSDVNGDTRLACDIRTWATNNTPGSATCEVAVKVPSVNSSTDTDIYMWWGKAGESQPAANDTYGQYNAYDSNYEIVMSMNEDPSGASPQMQDRTSHQVHGTSEGSMTSGDSVSAKVGNGVEFDGNDDGITFGGSTNYADTGEAHTVEACVNLETDAPLYPHVIALKSAQGTTPWEFIMGHNTNSSYQGLLIGSSGSSWGRYDDDKLLADMEGNHHVAATYNGSGANTIGNFATYLDGVATTLKSAGAFSAISNANVVANGGLGGAADNKFEGWIDELRISSVERSAAWIKAGYNNQFNIGTFLTWDTIADVGAAAGAFPFRRSLIPHLIGR